MFTFYGLAIPTHVVYENISSTELHCYSMEKNYQNRRVPAIGRRAPGF